MIAVIILITFWLYKAVLWYKNSKAPPKTAENTTKTTETTIIPIPSSKTKEDTFLVGECDFAWLIDYTNDNQKKFTCIELPIVGNAPKNDAQHQNG